MAEAKEPDKINKFMQGFLKYILDKEKKDEDELKELEIKAEKQLKQEQIKKRKDFLSKEKNKAWLEKVKQNQENINRMKENLKTHRYKKDQKSKFRELLKIHLTRKKELNKAIYKEADKQLLEELLPSQKTDEPKCDSNPNDPRCSIQG